MAKKSAKGSSKNNATKPNAIYTKPGKPMKGKGC